MKKDNFWKLIWNPFTRIAGWQAFVVGIVIVLVSAVIGKFAGLIFDGALDAHYTPKNLTYLHAICVSLIDIAVLFVFMTISAFILTKQFRIIDILGTMTMARTPFLLMAILALFVKQPEFSQVMSNPMIILLYPMFLVFIFLSLPILIWIIALMYHALKVSTGTNGSKLVVVFVLALIGAEIVSKVLLMAFCS